MRKQILFIAFSVIMISCATTPQSNETSQAKNPMEAPGRIAICERLKLFGCSKPQSNTEFMPGVNGVSYE
jgi:hypothetical protein